jgi:predicted ribosome quality control (RQC) complex YloA/Tae2 family protein
MVDAGTNQSAESLLPRLRKILLTKVLKRLYRKREKQEEELRETERAAWYRQIADSLLAAAPGQKGSAKGTLLNIHTQMEEPVALNPRFDFRGNAQLFYKKARKGDRGKKINAQKIAETDAEIAACEQFIAEAEAVRAAALPDGQKIADLCSDIAAVFGSYLPRDFAAPGAPQEIAGEKIPYRRFVIDEWDIYIGKNDRQNDEMTTRFAKPQDLWLHVAGHAGSHVVVRRPDRTAQVPQEVVRTAAALAVWFSKAKHTSYAEVNVTEARFVRKRRHAPAGEVIAERCKSVRVSPKSPQELFPGRYDDQA